MLSVEKRKGDLVVRLTGDIDHNAASRLCLALDEAMGKDPDIRRLIFDMRGGIGMLIGRYKRMKRRGGSVAVTGAEGRIDRIFTMAGLYQIIDKLA